MSNNIFPLTREYSEQLSHLYSHAKVRNLIAKEKDEQHRKDHILIDVQQVEIAALQKLVMKLARMCKEGIGGGDLSEIEIINQAKKELGMED